MPVEAAADALEQDEWDKAAGFWDSETDKDRTDGSSLPVDH
jgi:hypothetical protein